MRKIKKNIKKILFSTFVFIASISIGCFIGSTITTIFTIEKKLDKVANTLAHIEKSLDKHKLKNKR